MTTATRTDVFEALAQLSKRYPHWRLGQLLANVAGWADSEIWDVQDQQILAAVRAHLECQAKSNGATVQSAPTSEMRIDGRDSPG